MSDNLNARGYRFAYWEMLEREQPIELPRRTFESQLEGVPHISVTENALQTEIEEESLPT